MSIRFLPPALVAVFIALVAVGGAALAFGRGDAGSEATDDLLQRAASELGVESQALKDALQQAQSEISMERQQELLAKLVEDEVITQEQADEASLWLGQKPAVVDRLTQPEILIGIAARHAGDIVTGVAGNLQLPQFGEDVTEKMAEILGIDAQALEDALKSAREGQVEDSRVKAIDDMIGKLVEDGEITEAEGSEIKAWIESMPEWLGERGMLRRIFSYGLGGGLRSFGIDGFPFSPGLRDREFDELRHRGAPFFFAPREELQGPRFEFSVPEHFGPGNRFHYRGPEGEFNFEGEIPEEYLELFKGLNGRFGNGEGFNGLEGLFERLRPFHLQPPAEPQDSDAASTGVLKGA